MKAMIIKKFGGPEVFEQADWDNPLPGPTQLLVKVHATSVNPVDWKIRKLGLPLGPDLPAVLHGDVAGVVEAVGADVIKKIMIYTLLMHRQVPADRFFDLVRSAPWFDITAERYFADDRYGVFQRFVGELKERGLILEKDGVLTTPVQP